MDKLNHLKRAFLFKSGNGLMLSALILASGCAVASDNTTAAKAARAEPVESASIEHAPPLTLVVNKSSILRLDAPAARISVGNPAVADITPINPREIYVLGKGIGGTNLIIWNKSGATTMIDVNVIAEPVKAAPPPSVVDKDAVEVIKGLNKSQMEF